MTAGVVAETRSLDEQKLRRGLGVPLDAPRVMVVTESTHWDPNWMFRSGEYFRGCVRRSLDLAIDALLEEPRRVFSLECMFFVHRYWDARPARRQALRNLVNEGRLRFTGSGVTTPDTLLPEDESLLRDLLLGQEWLREREMIQEPRVLYLPDSFGHSPGLPSLLTAAGFDYAAICRIDGMRFPGADMESAARFPRPATTAESLFDEHTADFVWRGPDRSEVLAHWQAYGYGHGDMIASGGLSRALGLPASWPDRRESHVAARIDGYIRQLSRLACTPNMLLAIGYDFVRPVPRLVDLLDRWNEADYDRTGVWLVNAGLDDYLDLVACHRCTLPTLSLDPNPYWMGFYASRPDIKAACRDLGRRLVAADNETVRTSGLSSSASGEAGCSSRAELAASWWTAATSNHHDYVTGTGTERVATGEQMRWLRDALGNTPRAGVGGDSAEGIHSSGHDTGTERRLTWSRSGAQVTVATPWLTAVFDEHRGGALVSYRDVTGSEQLASPSLELRSYADSGGLWRMGNEFRGGRWALRDRSCVHPGEVSVHVGDDKLHLTIRGILEDRPTEIAVEFNVGDPTIRVRTSVRAPNRRTVTLATHLNTTPGSLTMHQPGGMVTRLLQRWYQPTFWPLHSFAAATPERTVDDTHTVLVIATATPTALHANPAGTVEIVVARTAVKEVAFGIIPVLAPAWGRRWGVQRGDVALEWTDRSDRASVIEVGRSLVGRVDQAVGRRAPNWLVETNDPLTEVIAVKLAHRGEGVIVRLRNWAPSNDPRPVSLFLAQGTLGVITSARCADSRERDLGSLAVVDGAVRLDVDRYLTTVRISIGDAAVDPSVVTPETRG